MIRSLRVESPPIDPGEVVTLTCPVPRPGRALHLEVDTETFVAFDVLHAEKSERGVHIEVRCRATSPSTFHGVLIVARDEGAVPVHLNPNRAMS
ncbi:MAG: hypothetical protein ABTD50_16450 [Polyangiaceae bacterium]